MNPREQPGYLLLEDGRRFNGELRGGVSHGPASGATEPGLGEVVFQTGMTGYQEVITDPSYRGQIVTFTAPHVGNTGMNPFDAEAAAPALAGIITRSLTHRPSSWRATEDLDAYLKRFGIPCLNEVDTRALTRHLRDAGAMRGVLARESESESDARRRLDNFPGLEGRDLVSEVMPEVHESTWNPSRVAALDAAHPARVADELAREFPPQAGRDAPSADGLRITIVHCGMKEGIDGCLRRLGASVRLVRPDVTPEELLAGDPDGVLLSNGPGDPAALTGLIATVRDTLGRVPMQGICLGFQVLALALGARTRKMKFGHHGINHPVRDLRTGRVLVTSQNHGFEVDADSLTSAEPDAVVTHVSLNDGTCEGFEVPGKRVRAVQFHPEAQAGPRESSYLFREFAASLKGRTE